MALAAVAKINKLVSDNKFRLDGGALEALPTLEAFVKTEGMFPHYADPLHRSAMCSFSWVP